MATLITLAQRLNRINRQIEQIGNDFAKEIAVQIVDDLAHNTPADTSLHLSNWRVGVGVPPQGVIEPHVVGSDGSSRLASARATVAAARAAVSAKRPGVPIFVSNSAPVIEQLNNGSSQRAPGGFVERAILLSKALVARRIRTLK